MYGEVDTGTPLALRTSEQTLGLIQLISATDDVVELRTRFHDYQAYCVANDVPLLRPIISHLESTLSSAIEAAKTKIDRELALYSLGEVDRQTVECEQMARLMLQTKSYVVQSFEWCAPSYDQSLANQFFDLRGQKNTTVNYERYESKEVEAIERQLADILAYSTEKTAVLLTSSGMSAYAVVEAFITRELLKDYLDTVLVSPYIYFEASGQLTTLNSLNVVFATSYETEQMLDSAETLQPKVIFLDPLSNTPEQRLIDLDAFFEKLGGRIIDRVTVVIDGTMSPGCYKDKWRTHSGNVDIIYYESCSKYLQLGFDSTMSGYVLAPVEWKKKMAEIRRNTGAILARDCANTFPRYSAATLWKRMDVIQRNAMAVVDYFDKLPAIHKLIEVHYPGHHTHPDFNVGKQYRTLGGCVSFKFHSGNGYDKLNRFISELIGVCKANNVQLIKGVSFGHTIPRISASSAMAGFDKPYIRLFVGALESDSILELCKAIEYSLLEGKYLGSGNVDEPA
jgi:cystathionine gamma-synthase